jgi:hypothetical protein
VRIDRQGDPVHGTIQQTPLVCCRATRYPDPSVAEGSEAGKRRGFELMRQAIGYRMLQLLALPPQTLDRAALQAALVEVGHC